MGRRSAQAQSTQTQSAQAPAPLTPALVDVRVLLVAALLVSPAAYRASQGLLSVDQVLTRYLLVALGCIAVTVLVRAMWPLVAGPAAEDQADDEPAEQSGVTRPPE